MRRTDWTGVAIVAVVLAAAWAFRAWVIDSAGWGAACALVPAPLACLPRQWVLWAEYRGLLGGLSLVLGIGALALPRRPLAVAALSVGAAGVINGSATFGLLGAALGGWSWLSPPRAQRSTAAAPGGGT